MTRLKVAAKDFIEVEGAESARVPILEETVDSPLHLVMRPPQRPCGERHQHQPMRRRDDL